MSVPALVFVIAHFAVFAPPGQAVVPGQPAAAIEALIAKGEYAEAEQAARARLAVLESRDPSSAEIPVVINHLVDALIRQGRSGAEVEGFVTRAIELTEARQPRTRAHVGALRNRGWLREVRGEIAPAIKDYEEAHALLREIAGPEDPATVMMQKDVAMVNRTAGNYARARALLEDALAVRSRTSPDHRDVAILWHNLGAVYWDLGEYTSARNAFTRAVSGLERALGSEHPFVALALEGLGVIEVSLGNYTDGAAALRRTLAIREKALSPEHPDIGSSLVNLADLLMTMGDYREAKVRLERALAIWEKALGPDNPQLVIALTNLAVARERLGDRTGARAAFERGIALREKAMGPDDATLVIPLTQLANIVADSGDLAAARPLYARARAIGERRRSADHPYVASAALAEGIRLAAFGETGAARPLLDRALRIRQNVLGTEHPDVAAAIDALARLSAAEGRDRDAVEEALRAEAIARRHFRETAATLSERQALLYGEERTRTQDLAVLAAARSGLDEGAILRRLWDTVIRSRALVLDEMAWRGRLATSVQDAGLQDLSNAVADARARLAQLFVRGPAEDGAKAYAGELNAAREAKERAEEQLAARSGVYRQNLTRTSVGLEDVRHAIPEGAALVSFVRYSADLFAPPAGSPKQEQFAYAAFVLAGPDATPRLVRLGPAEPIETLVAEWRRLLRQETTAPAIGAPRRERLYRQAGTRLRRLIWDPIAGLVQDARLVTIVPDGALHLVDVAVLPGGARQYLVEGGPTLHYASAERDLLPAPHAPVRAGSGMLAVGAPAFDRAPTLPAALASRQLRSNCTAVPGVRFAALPESGAEVTGIARLWRKTGEDALVLRGVEAGEASVKAHAPGRRVLHLATHGFVAGEGCRPDARAAAAGAADALEANPLLGAGLVLAGASRAARHTGGDDGILTAEEISALDLGGVEWAVLSACDSGVGTARAGEGIFGLRRAFQVAGVRTVIMSLWPVDDLQARTWMEALYRARFEESHTTPEAVRAANLAALQARRRAGGGTHPFYWSGFVAAGSWQ